MKKKIALGVAGTFGVAILAIVVAAMFQPDQFHVERSREIAASPEVIRPQLTDLRRWGEWNPWADLDPNAEMTYSDPSEGVGAHYEWHGNEDVGAGRMEIVESTPTGVRYDLRFIEPFESEAEVEITMAPAGEQTRVTWSMSYENDFSAKVMGLFMDMEEMIASDFERGFDRLEQAVATDTQVASGD